MKLTLIKIRNYYKNLEDNPQIDTNYMLHPIREHMEIFNNITQQSIVETINLTSLTDLQMEVSKIRDFLDQNYHTMCWPCHDVHFHNNFSHYIGCPSTCLNEIVECLDRIIEERFRN